MRNQFNKVKHVCLIVFLLIISAFAHGANMFHFPAYFDDEGIYMSQAWAVLEKGQLAPSTYFYDHSPLGWIQIAFWAFLTGGFSTFGFSLNSGRAFMFLFHIGSSLLLFLIAKKLSKNTASASMAVLLFSLSPLAIYFQRQVLLDNIMVFWFLLSLSFLLRDKKRLSFFILSAFFFSVAVLVKETAIFFLPVMLYVVFTRAHSHHRSFVTVKWLCVFFSICFLYILFAMLKGEFFPTNSLLGGHAPHVSLIETAIWQTTRKGGDIFNPNSQFRLSFSQWFLQDPLLIILSSLSLLVNLIVAFKKITYRYIVLFTLSFIFYLTRGGVVLGFYIIPLIPLLALNVGLSLTLLIETLPKKLKFPVEVFNILFIVFALFVRTSGSKLHWTMDSYSLFTKDQTSAQIRAVKWARQNIPADSLIVVDNYAYVDLVEQRGNTNIQSFWKIDRDPAIRQDLLHNKWQTINYILSSPSVRLAGQRDDSPFLRQALINSHNEAVFPNYNNWVIEVRRVDK